MGTCKECRHANRVKKEEGWPPFLECWMLGVVPVGLQWFVSPRKSQPDLVPPICVRDDFSCVYFGEKDKGPFSVICRYHAVAPNEWRVCFREKSGDELPLWIKSEEDALRISDWLNRLWTENH